MQQDSLTVNGWTRNLVELRESERSRTRRVPTYSNEEASAYAEGLRLYLRGIDRPAILPMAKNGAESYCRHGCGYTAGRYLSKKHQPLFNYFKQLFAQVTNPPIDAIREEVVTSTTVYIGEDGNLLEETRGKLPRAAGKQSDPDQYRSDEDQKYEGRRL